MTTDDNDESGGWLETLLKGLQMYYVPVLVYLGSLGNCFSVYVFFRSKMRKSSSSFYLAALAISDTGFLVSLFISWLSLMDIRIFNRQGFCQFFIYLTTLCSFLSVWFVVAFTVERFVAVRYPLHRQSMCTVARAKTILAGLTVVGAIICSPVLWFSEVTLLGRTVMCNLAEEWQLWASVFNFIDTILTLIVPFLLIAILNGLIARSVWRLANIRRTLIRTSNENPPIESSQHHSSPHCGAQTKVTKMLLIVSTVFLCFNLPAYAIRVYFFIQLDQEPSRTLVLVQHYSNLLFDTNFGINFVLYCASGQNFRKAVFRLLCRRRGRFRDRNTQLSSHVSDYLRSTGSVRNRTTVTDVWEDGIELQTLPT